MPPLAALLATLAPGVAVGAALALVDLATSLVQGGVYALLTVGLGLVDLARALASL